MRFKLLIILILSLLLSLFSTACNCPGKYTLTNGNLKISFECSEPFQSIETEGHDESSAF